MPPADSPSTPRVLVRGRIVDDTWTFLDDDAPLPTTGDLVLGCQRFLALPPDALEGHEGRVGVALDGCHDVRELGPHLHRVDLVTVRFPRFGDGRGYSQARILRDELGYRGELRAIGDVLRDQAFLLARCGFDAFVPAPELSIESFQAGLRDFSVTYQAAADEPRPIYRRAERPAAR